jgi:Ni/Co efflux regulator RcnB
MKRKIVSIIFFAALSLSGMAQNAEQRTVIRTDSRGVVKSVEYSNTDRSVTIPKSENEFFRDVLKTQTADRFDKTPSNYRQEGYVHEHFQQFYNGIRLADIKFIFTILQTYLKPNQP